MLVLAGCGMLGGGAPKVRLGDVRVTASPDANRNSPVVFEVVLVSDPALEQRLMASTDNWFASSAALGTTYPQSLRVYHCELTPGQELSLSSSLFEGQRAHAVFVFADLADGERRGRIESWADGGAISFARDGWRLSPRDKKSTVPPPPPRMACTT